MCYAEVCPTWRNAQNVWENVIGTYKGKSGTKLEQNESRI